MAIEQLLEHTCDIYHLQTGAEISSYGLPTKPSFSYGDTADISAVMCHFSIKSGTFTLEQGEPQKILSANLKLILPLNTDIRLNDKVVDNQNGREYTAEIPRTIRNHHIAVIIKPTKQQEAL